VTDMHINIIKANVVMRKPKVRVCRIFMSEKLGLVNLNLEKL
jgi:hypothetical protein